MHCCTVGWFIKRRTVPSLGLMFTLHVERTSARLHILLHQCFLHDIRNDCTYLYTYVFLLQHIRILRTTFLCGASVVSHHRVTRYSSCACTARRTRMSATQLRHVTRDTLGWHDVTGASSYRRIRRIDNGRLTQRDRKHLNCSVWYSARPMWNAFLVQRTLLANRSMYVVGRIIRRWKLIFAISNCVTTTALHACV